MESDTKAISSVMQCTRILVGQIQEVKDRVAVASSDQPDGNPTLHTRKLNQYFDELSESEEGRPAVACTTHSLLVQSI